MDRSAHSGIGVFDSAGGGQCEPASRAMATEAGQHEDDGGRHDDGLRADGKLSAFWAEVSRDPHGHDLYRVLRTVDARAGAPFRLGRAASPRHEPLRLRQTPHLVFAPSTLSAASPPRDDQPASVSIFSFGLFGPNGPLPLHMTEYARERLLHHGDGTLAAFADLFHHRLILLFYRAWADAQDTASLDHDSEPFSRYLASLLHLGMPAQRGRGSVADHARYGMAGHLVRQTRNVEGLVQILRAYFDVRVRIVENVAQWVRLESASMLCLGRDDARLGQGTVLGAAVRDAAHRFRIEIGPLPRSRYMRFLPGGDLAQRLLDWIRHYVGIEYEWDVRLILQRSDVHGLRLGGHGQPLGRASWLGLRGPQQGDADDFIHNPGGAAYRATPVQPDRTFPHEHDPA